MDIGDAPVLMKTKGKTTTDDISPAGSWLRFRGHLGRFSDNLLLTAVNAYNGKRGTTHRRAVRRRRPEDPGGGPQVPGAGAPVGHRRRRELR